MKGVIFNLFERFIVENWGVETYEEVLDACELKTTEPFVGPGTYPDEDLLTVVAKASEQLSVPIPDAVRAFGKFLFPKLAEGYPDFVKPYTHPKPFLKTIDAVIHVEVKKLYKDAVTPKFRFHDPGPRHLVMTYASERKLYQLVEGLLEGVSDYFQSPIQWTWETKVEDGEEIGVFDLTFSVEEPHTT